MTKVYVDVEVDLRDISTSDMMAELERRGKDGREVNNPLIGHGAIKDALDALAANGCPPDIVERIKEWDSMTPIVTPIKLRAWMDFALA